jgi:acyl-CoA synthetase (NDP forming)
MSRHRDWNLVGNKIRAKLQQPNAPAAAVETVRENQAHGSNVVKLIAGPYLTPDNITHMPLEIAKAAVQAGHDHQQLAFAHPSQLKGVQIAIEGGVDVLGPCSRHDCRRGMQTS